MPGCRCDASLFTQYLSRSANSDGRKVGVIIVINVVSAYVVTMVLANCNGCAYQ